MLFRQKLECAAIRHLCNPALLLLRYSAPGLSTAKTFTVESDLTPANGEWTIYNVYYDFGINHAARPLVCGTIRV